MCWSKLNNHELQATRKLLMLDVREAAELIGKVSVRTWQYWESGQVRIPDDIDLEMYALIQQRNKFLDELTEKQIDFEKNNHQHEENFKLKYYHDFESFLKDFPEKNKVCWKIHQSTVSCLFSDGGNIELI